MLPYKGGRWPGVNPASCKGALTVNNYGIILNSLWQSALYSKDSIFYIIKYVIILIINIILKEDPNLLVLQPIKEADWGHI